MEGGFGKLLKHINSKWCTFLNFGLTMDHNYYENKYRYCLLCKNIISVEGIGFNLDELPEYDINHGRSIAIVISHLLNDHPEDNLRDKLIEYGFNPDALTIEDIKKITKPCFYQPTREEMEEIMKDIENKRIARSNTTYDDVDCDTSEGDGDFCYESDEDCEEGAL